MYEIIRARRSVPQLYEDKLIVRATQIIPSFTLMLVPKPQAEEVLDHTDIANIRSAYKSTLDDGLSKVGSHVPSASMLEDQWTGMVWPASKQAIRNPDTGIERQILIKVGKASVNVPEGFVSHLKV
jgi:probable 2-oxoglutarate dehydrogenase E1 component DHKTD1